MDIRSHLEALRINGERLAVAASTAGLDAKVPTCPDWTVRYLVQHLSGVHRWAALNVTHGRATRAQVEAAFEPPDDDELLAWFRAGHEALIRTLTEADPAVEAFTFLPAPSALAFWARRQAHETAIHSADAEAAAGIAPAFPTDFAVDGLDELLGGFMSRSGGRLRSDPPVTLGVAAVDSGRTWTMRIGPNGGSCEPGRVTASPTGHATANPTGFSAAGSTGLGSDMTADTAADATVRGTASDLYLFLWNRLDRDAIALDGDPAVLDLWRDQANVRWG